MFYIIIALFIVSFSLLLFSWVVERSSSKEDLSYTFYIGKSGIAIGSITNVNGYIQTLDARKKLLSCRTYVGVIPHGMTVLITGYDKIRKSYMVEISPPISP